MNEIDQSCWLPHGEPIITPERAGKGDILIEKNNNGDIRFAQANVRNILNYLWDEDIISHEQHDDAVTFQIWRDMHQVAFCGKKPVSSGNQEIAGIRLRAYGYVLLIKRLSKPDQKAIEMALETFATEYARFIAKNNKKAYQGVFERLSAAIPPIREQINYLEGLSEIERNEISQDGLKKLVATFGKKV